MKTTQNTKFYIPWYLKIIIIIVGFSLLIAFVSFAIYFITAAVIAGGIVMLYQKWRN